jgi:hypothetical protein
MDFIIIPSNRTSFGLPQIKGRSWFAVLAIIQVVYLILYHFVGQERARLFNDLFSCRSSRDCVSSQFVVFVDWFIASISIVVPMITSELLLNESVYFSYHYIYFVRLFLPYRVLALAVLLPIFRVPLWFLGAASLVHLGTLAVMVRIFYVLLKEIERSRSSLIAIQFSFRLLVVINLTKVLRSLDGATVSVSPAIFTVSGSTEVCPICFEPLAIASNRSVTSVSRSRVNASVHRPQIHGKLNIFTTSCNHSFHKDCLMRWISGKPIKVTLGVDSGNEPQDGRRTGASCPVCARGIQLKVEWSSKYLVEFLWNGQL